MFDDHDHLTLHISQPGSAHDASRSHGTALAAALLLPPPGRPERLAEYIAVHQHVWQDMRDALSNAGWRRYSLFLRPEDGLVVGYFESDDTAAAMRAMEDEDVNTRWQKEMAQYFVQPNGGTPEILAQYFYLA